MKDRLTELQETRRRKSNDYNKIPSYSWKKKLYKMALDIIDIQIKMEQLRRQYR